MIRLIKPYVGFDDVSSELKEILDSGILTKGRYSHEFPARMAEYTGASHAFLTTSATTALTMSLKVLGVGSGDEVLVSDFSFPASVNVIEDLGARPVFVDVSPDTYNMVPEQLESRISERAKACIFVDALGNPSGLGKIRDICHAHGIVLIEDAACAIGSKLDGVKIGHISDLTCFSLHPRKLLTCGEGGVITTDDDGYADFFTYKLSHGMDPETGEFISYGYNYRMPEISCMLGCSQLPRIDAIVEERRSQKAHYARLLEPLGFVPQKATDEAYHNVQSVVFTVPDGCDRDGLIAYLAGKEIESTIGTYCLSECRYYKEKYDDVQPVASFLQHHTITLPCYSDVPVEEVCEAVREYVQDR